MAIVCRRNHGELAPWSALRDLEAEFRRMFGDDERGLSPFAETWTPSMDLRETEQAYFIEADIPGLNKKDLAIEVLDNVVTIQGERKNEHKESTAGYRRVERRYGSFRRVVEVPRGFDADRIEASFKDGVLRVTLPKSEEVKPKRIKVKAR